MARRAVRRALISVSDKSGIAEFSKGLEDLSWEIISTGGTARFLRERGVKVKEVSEITGFPEILDGRVKTLHPKIHGGILARRNLSKDMDELSRHQVDAIDMVVVNLYPFRETAMKEGVTFQGLMEEIDIGGPTLLRASAKNWPFVIVLCDPSQYGEVLLSLKAKGDLSPEERLRLAFLAFNHTAAYDSAVASYLGMLSGAWPLDFPKEMTFGLEKAQDLRYGENPHQKAAYYEFLIPCQRIDQPRETLGEEVHEGPFEGLEGLAEGEAVFNRTLSLSRVSLSRGKIQGQDLSFNNIGDIDAAFSLVSEFSHCASVVVKHASPCGVALGKDPEEAFLRAFDGDPISGFGGVVAFNREVDGKCAEAMRKIFLEVVVGPSFTEEALSILSHKKNLKVLAIPETLKHRFSVKSSLFGVLVQEKDRLGPGDEEWKVVSKRIPSDGEVRDLRFAMTVCKYVKSNAVVMAKNMATCGIGGGQPNRVDAVRIAAKRAEEKAQGSVMASDAFFPFPDAVEEAAKAGVMAICHPGGSVRDEEVLKKADELGISMIITGRRHFLH